MRISRLILLLALTTACQDTASPRLSVAVVPSTLTMISGDTARVATTESRVRVTWRSAAPSVATVDATGLVTALVPGATSIWAVRGADSAAAVVTVTRIMCAGGPSIAPANAMLVVGDTLRVAASDGCSTIAGAAEWIVSAPEVATVTSRGLDGKTSVATVTARGVGLAVITARSVDDPTISVSMAVTVKIP